MSIPVNSLYSLTWGDYGTSLVSAVQLLRCHGDLVDVTLAAEGRSFEAHKIVLCAASPYLLNLLKVSTAIFFFFTFTFATSKMSTFFALLSHQIDAIGVQIVE
jgi:hypothetical protein